MRFSHKIGCENFIVLQQVHFIRSHAGIPVFLRRGRFFVLPPFLIFPRPRRSALRSSFFPRGSRQIHQVIFLFGTSGRSSGKHCHAFAEANFRFWAGKSPFLVVEAVSWRLRHCNRQVVKCESQFIVPEAYVEPEPDLSSLRRSEEITGRYRLQHRQTQSPLFLTHIEQQAEHRRHMRLPRNIGREKFIAFKQCALRRRNSRRRFS